VSVDLVQQTLAEKFDLTPESGGFLTHRGLFIKLRPHAPLWDVWMSVEAHALQANAGLLAANLSTLRAAVQAADDEGAF